jgi:RNA polymerase sigma-70 factor, ECF subfamily
MWEHDYHLAGWRIAETKQFIAVLKFTNQQSAAAQSILEALEASLHGFECHRQLRLELYSAVALKRGTASWSPALFRRERDRGEPFMLKVSVRPQPAAVAAVSALAATAGKTSSDETLIEQIAAGSKPAMQALFARHRTYVYRWLLRLVSNETLAEDLLSEVFLDVWRQAGRFQRRSSVSTWLMAIARHKALSARRRRIEGAELDEKIEATIADPANDPEVALQEKDRGELVRRALMRLSTEHREVIDLVYYHEKSVDEVAHILDVPPATVKTRMFYARKKLGELVKGAEKVRC